LFGNGIVRARYDYIITDDHQVGLLIADVSGHGVPAALIAAMVKLAAASQRAVAAKPCQFLAGMNLALLGDTQSRRLEILSRGPTHSVLLP